MLPLGSLYDAQGGLLASGETGEDGTYRLDFPAGQGGALTLVAGAAGAATLFELAEGPAPGRSLTKDLVLLPRTFDLEGYALDADGNPVSGEMMLLADGVGKLDTVTINADGYFRFRNESVQPSGWYGLRLVSERYTLAGSLTHGTDVVPLLNLPGGGSTVVTILARPR